MAVFALCPHMVFVCVCVQTFSSCKDTGHIESGFPWVIPFYLSCLCRDSVSKCSHVLRCWGEDFNIRIWWGDTIHSIMFPLGAKYFSPIKR